MVTWYPLACKKKICVSRGSEQRFRYSGCLKHEACGTASPMFHAPLDTLSVLEHQQRSCKAEEKHVDLFLLFLYWAIVFRTVSNYGASVEFDRHWRLEKLYFANSSGAWDLSLLNVQFPSRCVSSECKPFPIVNLIFLVTKEPLKLKLSNRLPINDDSDKLGKRIDSFSDYSSS